MIQILGFWSSIEFGIINGIYSLVIKVYDIMEKILKDNAMDMSKFESIATTLYVLAGVFILFKVVIAMIQMILNPDLVTDKQAGAGKLITRIVTCLIMLIAFSPNGFLFGYEGLFSRIEKAVLADDGLINNIINVDLSDQSSSSSSNSGSTTHESSSGSTHGGSSGNFASSIPSSFLIENVYAATKVNCYYYRISSSENNYADADAHGNERKKIKVDKIYKISYYYNPNETTISNEDLTKARNSKKVYYKERSGVIGGSANCSTSNCAEYNHLAYPIKMAGGISTVERTIKNGKCPGSLVWDKNDKTWKAQTTGASSTSPGLRGGTSSLSDLKDKLKKISVDVAGFDSGGNSFVDSSNGRSKPTGDDYLFFTPVSDNAIKFGQATASSLQECVPSAQSDCIKYQKDMFETKSANKEIVNLIDQENLEVSFIFSIIAGIGLIIYLLFLCVEIIIRRLKLFFLEVLAPIPIISYVDPKDKTFSTWIKMYIATYLDLFIKLIAIKIAIELVATVSNEFWSTGNIETGIIGGVLIKFFYIVAILAFAKILPTMISKIFNLDSMGGSFKDIMGMAKGAAGFGAGAVLGAGAGLVSGFSAAAKAPGMKNKLLAGAGAIGSGMSGLAKGAGSGAKGNILGGAKDVAAINSKRRSLYAGGITAMDMLKGATLGRVGMDAASRTDRKLEKEQLRADSLVSGGEVFNKMKSNAKDTKLYQNLAGYKDASGNSLLNANEQSKLADIITQGSLMGEESGTDYIREQISSSFGEKGNQLLSIHGNNDLYEAKEAGNIQRAYKEYSSFISNNGDVKGVLADNDYLVNELGLTEADLRLLNSNDIEHATARTKLQNRVLNETSNNIKTDISIQKGQPGYKASAAVRDQGKNNS